MSTSYLPVGLPPGYDLDSAEQIRDRQTFSSAQTSITVQVPGGEAWLMQSVRGKGTRGAGATDETLRFQILDQSSVVVASVEMALALGASFDFYWTFAAGINTTATTFGTTSYSLNQSLPLYVMPATFSFKVWLDAPAANDTIVATGAGADGGLNYTYTRYYVEGTAPGGEQNELLGPYMLVPGPETA